jgi:mRNA interferase MazF
MNNYFFIWSKIKGDLDKRCIISFKERDVFLCHLGLNIGSEQNGSGKSFLRPVLVLKKFNNKICLAIPLTTKNKIGEYYFSFKLKGVKNTLILSQIRLVDSKRFKYKKGFVTKKDFIKIKNKITKIIS